MKSYQKPSCEEIELKVDESIATTCQYSNVYDNFNIDQNCNYNKVMVGNS